MLGKNDQRAYWSKVATQKSFRHPIDWDQWTAWVPPAGKVLDYGCGYGRLTHAMHQRGYQAVGVDRAAGMIAEARRRHPALSFLLLQAQDWPFETAQFDGVLLFTVLTCLPDTADQQRLLEGLAALLVKGGVLYLSDLLLNDDERHLARYAHPPEGAPYGVFQHEEGICFRHHTADHLKALLEPAFELKWAHPMQVTTMNGHTSKALQLIGVKR